MWPTLLAVSLLNTAHALAQTTGGPLPYTFTTVRYVDFKDGDDTTGNGRRLKSAWKTIAKAIAEEYTPHTTSESTRQDPVSLMIVVAGGSDADDVDPGTDQLRVDCITDGRADGDPNHQIGFTAIGLRAAVFDLDGPRRQSPYGRPRLRADTPLVGELEATAPGIYKTTAPLTGDPANISEVLWKSLDLTQRDADGASLSHLKVLGQGTLDDASIAALLSATQYSAYYQTAEKRLHINTAGLDAKAGNYAWTATSGADSQNWAKVWLAGVNYVSVQGVDIDYGERGVAAFDCGQVNINDVRVYEPTTHGIVCSYSNWPLTNITIRDCSVFGLGQSAVGDTMFAATGSSGDFNSDGVVMRRCTAVRYMLQTPGGTNYAPDYGFHFVGAGTSYHRGNGHLLPRGFLVEDCTFRDVSAAKTRGDNAGIYSLYRAAPPANTANVDDYPLVFRRLRADIIGTVYDAIGHEEEGSHAVAYDNCQIYQRANVDLALNTLGFPACVLFEVPPAPPAGGNGLYYIGMFNGTSWVCDIGAGRPGGQSGWCVKTDENFGNFCFLTKVASTFAVATSGRGRVYLYDQSDYHITNNDGTQYPAAQKGLVLHCQGGLSAVLAPDPANSLGQICLQDTTMVNGKLTNDKSCRIFTNEGLCGIDFKSGVTTQYRTLADWIEKVDSHARVVQKARVQSTLTPISVP